MSAAAMRAAEPSTALVGSRTPEPGRDPTASRTGDRAPCTSSPGEPGPPPAPRIQQTRCVAGTVIPLPGAPGPRLGCEGAAETALLAGVVTAAPDPPMVAAALRTWVEAASPETVRAAELGACAGEAALAV